MKKRLLSALLALALVFVLLPTTALAETPAIKIAGTVIEDGKYYYTNGGIGELKTEAQQKTWNVRRDGNTLYLKNAKINTTDTQSIQVWMMSVTINLEGDSTITTKGESSIVSQLADSLTINGNGKLTIESNTAGSSIVWNSGDVTITGDAVVNITNENSGQSSDAIGLVSSYELTVSENAKLRAVSNGSKAATVNGGNLTIADNAEFNVINQNSSGKAVSFKSIEVAAGYDCNGINGNGITDWTKTTAEELNTFQKVWVKPTPTPTLEKSNVCVAGTNLYKNTAYTIQNGKPVMGGTYPDNYNIYLDATGSNYVLHVKDAVIEATGNARGTTGIYGTSNIVFEGDNSITASTYGIYSYFTQSDLKISGTGSLNVKTIAGEPAIATAYDTSRSIIISGNDFTVTADTSGTTSYAIKSDKDLTITGGAAVTAKSNATRAIDIKGDLTVTNGSLTATSTSNNVPTVQVGGNASFTGSTVTITNNSTTQGKSGKNSYEVSTGLYVGGTLDIKNAAKVTSTVIGGNAIYAKGDITISGDSTEVKATNDAYKFSAISTNKTVNISDNSTVKAENLKKHQGDHTGETDPSTGKTYNACPAITGKIANKNTQNNLHIAGFTTSNAGSQNPTEGTPLYLDIAPGSVEPYIHHYKVTITRGDEVTRTNSPVVIAGTTLLNDTYYTITNGSKVAEGTEDNYNAFYDSETKTLKLNNAQISHSFAHEYGDGTDGAIIFKEYKNYCIELSGTNTISSMNTYAINGDTNSLTIKNAAGTENAKLTLTGNWTAICSTEGLNIQSDVTMVNTKEAGHLMYVNGTFSFDGYNAYASVNASGSPLVEYTVPTSGEKDAGYQYLRITKETLETGGGSTCQHDWDEAWHDTGDGHHAHQCTKCQAFDTAHQQAHDRLPDESKGLDKGHTLKCGLCGYKYDQSIIESHVWSGWETFEQYFQLGDHAQRCNCGQLGHRHLKGELVYRPLDSEYHQQICSVEGCGYPGRTSKSEHVYEENSDICKYCGYDKSAPCDHTGDLVYTNNGDGTHKVTCKACGATIVEKQSHEFGPTGACIYCGATQPGGDPTPDNPGTIVIIRPAEEEKPAQQPNPSTGANDLVGLAVAAAVAAALGSAALLRKHD